MLKKVAIQKIMSRQPKEIQALVDAMSRREKMREAARCERCGSQKPVGSSCDCFDNHCQ